MSANEDASIAPKNTRSGQTLHGNRHAGTASWRTSASRAVSFNLGAVGRPTGVALHRERSRPMGSRIWGQNVTKTIEKEKIDSRSAMPASDTGEKKEYLDTRRS